MPLTVQDLIPKKFKVTVGGVELESAPLRLSHALLVAQVGEVFSNTSTATKQQIKDAETTMDEIISELIPELAGTQLSIPHTMELIGQLLDSVNPSDNQELKEKGVDLNADPKAAQ